MKKRMLSILLIFCMIFSMMPVSAFAAEAEPHDHGADTPATQTIYLNGYFALYNRQDATSEEYSRLDCEFGKASDCIVCGQCEKICPQQLSIRKLLRDVAERFE